MLTSSMLICFSGDLENKSLMLLGSYNLSNTFSTLISLDLGSLAIFTFLKRGGNL